MSALLDWCIAHWVAIGVVTLTLLFLAAVFVAVLALVGWLDELDSGVRS